jgi:hypothetical protein
MLISIRQGQGIRGPGRRPGWVRGREEAIDVLQPGRPWIKVLRTGVETAIRGEIKGHCRIVDVMG